MINVRYAIENETIVAWETSGGFHASALATSQEVLDHLAAGGQIAPYAPPVVDPKEQARADLAASDKEMARIAEDLIEILKAKGVIADSDLTQIVADKLVKRKQLRDAIKM